MQKSTILALLAATAVTVSAANPGLSLSNTKPVKGQRHVPGMSVKGSESLSVNLKSLSEMQPQHKADRKAAPRKVKKHVDVGPSEDMPIITEAPDGVSTTYVRTGIAWGYNFLFGLIVQPSDGSINQFVVTEDNKVYFNNIFSLTYVDAWLEGEVKDGKYSFSFPQHIEHDEEDYGTPDEPDIEIDDYYAVVLEFVDDEDGGWYYPAEDQTYTFTVNPDGSLTADNPDLMIGACQWEDGTEYGEESYWGWIILGDQYETFSELTAVAEPAPDEVEFENWTLVDGPFATAVEVGFLDGKCYLKGFTPDYPDLMDTPVVGNVEEGKIVFPSGQYLGVIEDYLTTAYFITGETSVLEDEYGPYETFDMTDNVVFDYSKEENLLKTLSAFCISSAADKVLYYQMFSDVAIKKPDADAKITALKQPVLDAFEEADPDWGMPTNVMFFLPMTDEDYNILDTEKYFWNLLLDDDVYVFAADEYVGLADMFGPDFEMTDVPYGFYDGCDFWGGWSGNEDFFLYAEGYETLAVRGVYKEGDNVIYSPLLYVVGEPSAVKEIENSEVVSTSYFDLQGRKLPNPIPGLCIRADKMADGSVHYVKVVRK